MAPVWEEIFHAKGAKRGVRIERMATRCTKGTGIGAKAGFHATGATDAKEGERSWAVRLLGC